MKKELQSSLGSRPAPPQDFIESLWNRVQLVPELGQWVQSVILAEDGPLHNPDHAHLIDVDLRFLWASGAFNKQDMTVIGQAEQVMFRAGGWQKVRYSPHF
tara:strand:- start:3991 stop:4293 length:303 start_codon:yes stop_codon:yes gene_type:complete